MNIEMMTGHIRWLLKRIKYRKYKQVKFLPFSYLPKNVEFEIDPGCKFVELKNINCYRTNTYVRVRKEAELYIDSGSTLNNGCIITCREKIQIGRNVLIGPNVMIFDNDHDYRSHDLFHNFKTQPIIIGDNVWIGANSLILKGSEIGENSVIGGGTIVKGCVPANSLFVNNHNARIISFQKDRG